MSDTFFESFYREIFNDLTIDREESAELKEKFLEVNPPPDKFVWLRAAAFRIGSEFLSDDQTSNKSLLRCIHGIVHAFETTCMEPTLEVDDTSESFDKKEVEDFYRKIYSDLAIDKEESSELFDFFRGKNRPPKSQLVWTRTCAFRIGCEFLRESNSNIALLRCINYVVHAFESCCLKPKEFVLKNIPIEKISITSIGLDASINEAVQHLWDLDLNRLTPDQDYVINVGKGKKPYWKGDSAHDPLFTKVDASIFKRPTYKHFISLLDNYERETGNSEHISSEERRENWSFLEAIMQTAPMQFCHRYCAANNKDIPKSKTEFMKLLQRIWFDLYFRERGEGKDSSGFEHVFVGEIKNGQVSGFHNWIMFYHEEKNGNADYQGYIKPKNISDAETDSNDHILTLQFKWHGVTKLVGTSFIGVSPEFEMALYTICFLVGQKENKVELNTGTDTFLLNVKVYRMAGNKIGTSYVEALEHHD